ncbi:tetratricopeptide repeat protein [Massilia sp. NR 4-1]|uniref:tetratricopeptide repeat protein n=1 Tax=Massilia sp. NR 4-1 TaxID=1678028 RepID=UPI00067E1DDB|nr:tetratricopeptide repeat protein [Massilia sp. NR 4-1]AKU21098.1 ABC transporter permease [Massilia sp. NR 4-1]
MKILALATLSSCLLMALQQADAAAARPCTPYVKGEHGGDYRNAEHRAGLAVVEQFHFTAVVEKLERGLSDTLGGDIGYTLEHFPNHPRALAAMARLALRQKTQQPPGAHYTVGCFFERAMRYVPDDARVRSLFGGYLLAQGQNDDALEQFAEAARLAPDDPATHYNLGLLYLKKKDYGAALESARRAYAAGFPLPGLRNKLKALGQWPDD